MPELPEVETIKKQLEKTVQGSKISQVIINKPRVIKNVNPKQFQKEIEGQQIVKVLRKGKAVILELNSGKSLVIQLGMTGQLIYPGYGKNSRVSFVLSDNKILDFNDTRMFGGLSLIDSHEDLAYLKNLGPEPFNIDVKKFQEMLINKKTKIKILLMDQQFISGIGNIYANEALFRSGIDPQRPANSLTQQESSRLFQEIVETLKEAIKHKGSSVDNYVQLTGDKGSYVPHLKIYGREKDHCLECKGSIKRIVLGGRGTFFCPRCQK